MMIIQVVETSWQNYLEAVVLEIRVVAALVPGMVVKDRSKIAHMRSPGRLVHIYVVYCILMIRRRQNDDHRASADEAYEREKGGKGERVRERVSILTFAFFIQSSEFRQTRRGKKSS